MAKTVELLGPSGVGKTAIYNRLLKIWSPNPNWALYDNFKKPKGNGLKRVLHKIVKETGITYRKSTSYSLDVPVEWEFIEGNNSPYLNSANSQFHSTMMDLIEAHCKKGFNNEDSRFITAYYTMWCMAFDQTIRSKKDDARYCIMKNGEGFLNRIMHFNTPSFDKDSLNKYLKVVPYPAVVIRIDLSSERILERIMSRNRVSTIHRGMTEDEILVYTKKTNRLLDIAVKKAKKQGAFVYDIDGNLPVHESASKISDYLLNLPKF